MNTAVDVTTVLPVFLDTPSARILIILFPQDITLAVIRSVSPKKYGVYKIVVMDTVGGITPPPQRA